MENKYEAFSYDKMSRGLKNELREFALYQIKEAYGFDYREDWHADLDSLMLSSKDEWYAPANRGEIISIALNGRIIATGGLHPLERRPDILNLFKKRYPDPQAIASVARVYVTSCHRRRGIASILESILAGHARKFGFRKLYLHTNTGSIDANNLWQNQGYGQFAEFDFSTHYDRNI